MISSSLRCSAPYNSSSISTLLAALPYMLSSLCNNSSMEASEKLEKQSIWNVDL